MKWLLLLPILFLTACGKRTGFRPCEVVPPENREKAAATFVTCVEAATAKVTGENQDADDWVQECRYSVKSIYAVEGTEGWAADCWDCSHYSTTPCTVPERAEL